MTSDDHFATACSSRQKRFCNRAGGSARPALARSAQSATKWGDLVRRRARRIHATRKFSPKTPGF